MLQNGAVLLLSMFASDSQPYVLGAEPRAHTPLLKVKELDDQQSRLVSTSGEEQSISHVLALDPGRPLTQGNCLCHGRAPRR